MIIAMAPRGFALSRTKSGHSYPTRAITLAYFAWTEQSEPKCLEKSACTVLDGNPTIHDKREMSSVMQHSSGLMMALLILLMTDLAGLT
jgi:hypothetical protein